MSDHCYSFVHVYHWLILFINGGCSTGRNVCFLTMYYYRPWPDVVMITLALCDVYKLTVKNLVESPKHLVKELFWREFEWSHILWQCIVLCSDYFVFDCVLILCAFMFCCFGVINDVCMINSQNSFHIRSKIRRNILAVWHFELPLALLCHAPTIFACPLKLPAIDCVPNRQHTVQCVCV